MGWEQRKTQHERGSWMRGLVKVKLKEYASAIEHHNPKQHKIEPASRTLCVMEETETEVVLNIYPLENMEYGMIRQFKEDL